MESSQSVSKGKLARKLGVPMLLLVTITVAMVVTNLMLVSNTKSKLNHVNSYDVPVETLANNAYNNFLTMDDQSNMWLGLRNYGNKSLSQTTYSQIISAEGSLNSILNQLATLTNKNASDINLVHNAQTYTHAYESYFNQVRQDYTSNPKEAAYIMYVGNTNASNDLTNALTKLESLAVKSSTADISAADHMSLIQQITMWVSGILVVIVGIGLLVLIIRAIAPIPELSREIESVSGGDLTREVKRLNRNDELGEMSEAIANMVKWLRDIMETIGNTASHVATASEELSASSEETTQASQNIRETIAQLAMGAERASLSTDETAKSVSEMVAGIQQISTSAQSVAESASNAKSVASSGIHSIENAVQQMSSIHSTVDNLNQSVRILDESSREIKDMASVMDDIASRTTMLSLNAHIEAARAGEAGRGFSVVAEAVRELAEQSTERAKQIVKLVDKVQREINTTVQHTDEASKQVTTGLELVNVAGTSFQDILYSVTDVSGQIVEVSAAVEEMAAGTEQMAHTVDEVSATTRETAASTDTISAAAEQQLVTMEQLSSASVSLSEKAEELSQLVTKFRV